MGGRFGRRSLLSGEGSMLVVAKRLRDASLRGVGEGGLLPNSLSLKSALVSGARTDQLAAFLGFHRKTALT
jgi:hypothetical protein